MTGTIPCTISFENNDLTEWDSSVNGSGGSSPSVSTSYVASGNYACELKIVNTAWSYSELRLTLSTSYPKVHYKGYCRISSLPLTGQTLYVGMGMRGNTLWSDIINDVMICNTDGVIKWGITYSNASGYSATLSTLTPVVDIWHYIEIMSSIDNSNGIHKMWVGTLGQNVTEDSPIISLSGLDNNYYGSIQNIVGFLYAPSGLICTAYIDALKTSTSFIGPTNFEISTITASTTNVIKTGSNYVTITALWTDLLDKTITSYQCDVYLRDDDTLSTLGPYACNISKLSSSSFQGSIAIDPDASFPLSYYSVKAIVSRT